MQRMIFLFGILILLSFQKHLNNRDRVPLQRIEYIYNLKSLIDKNAWKGFMDKKFDLPLVYYTDTVCYIANPTEKFIVSYKPTLIFDNTIASIEQCYETKEGTARYVEYSLYSSFAKKQPNQKLRKSDTSYHSYQYFQNYNLEKDQWLYLSEKTNYFYATGFNIVRLLDKLKIEYKTRLFNEGGLSLEQILKHRFAKTGN